MLRLSLVFIFCFTLVNVVVRAFGSTQPPDPALDGFTVDCEGMPKPCWYGIAPGITTIGDADRLLTNRGYSASADGLGTLVYWQPRDLCSRVWIGQNDGRITHIGLPVCTDVRLGSLAILFDSAFHLVTQSGVTLRNGQVALGLGAGNAQCMNINPFGRVSQIWLSAASEVQNFKPDLPLWRGYLSFTRYQRLYRLGCVPLRPQGVK